MVLATGSIYKRTRDAAGKTLLGRTSWCVRKALVTGFRMILRLSDLPYPMLSCDLPEGYVDEDQ